MGTWVPNDWDSTKIVTPSAPWTVVKDRFDLSTEYAESSFAITTEFIAQLEALLGELVVPESTIGDVAIPDLEPLSYDNRPALGDLTLEEIPGSDVVPPAWVAIPDFEDLEFPDNDAEAPSYLAPVKPDHDDIADPGDPPELATIEYPAKPDIAVPSVPALETIVFPAAPTITIAAFDGEAPTEIWDMPENFSYTEAEYSSDIWADLLSKVLNDIRNGGTGLGAVIEEELYARALARQETENERLYAEVDNYFEARGWPEPIGAHGAKLYEVGREISRNNAKLNTEITINQAELAQTNTHFMVEKGVALEGMLRDFFNQQATRSFEASKAIASAGIEIFNANVNKFNARVQLYQSEAAVFEARVKAALTQAQIYKTQIDACGVKSDIQKNLVAIYAEKVKALDTIIKIYATEMEAVRIKADVEKSRYAIFELQVKIYIARIEADKAKFDVYVRELEGERTKAQIYSEQIKGYLGEVEAVKSQSDVQIQTSDLALKENQIKSEKYRAELAGYETLVRSTLAGITSEVEGFKAETMAYSAETEAEGSWLAAKVQEMRLGVEKAKVELEKAVGEINATIQGYAAVKGLQVEGTTGIMNAAAQLCASAMNAVNATASIGYDGNESNTETWTHGESITETHPYEDQAA